MAKKSWKSKSENNKNGLRENENEKIKEKNKVAILERLIYPSLSFFETFFITAVWITFLLYVWYLAYKVSQKHYPDFLSENLLVKTRLNKILDHQADYSDREWKVFSEALTNRIPWILIHFILSQFLRKWSKEMLPLFNMVISASYLCYWFGTKPTFWLFIQPILMYIVHLSGSSVIVWVGSFVLLFVTKQFTGPLYYMHRYCTKESTGAENYVIIVTWYWVNSRCVSFCLDRIWKEVKPSQFR